MAAIDPSLFDVPHEAFIEGGQGTAGFCQSYALREQRPFRSLEIASHLILGHMQFGVLTDAPRRARFYFLNRLSNAVRASLELRGSACRGAEGLLPWFTCPPFDGAAESRATVTREENKAQSFAWSL